MRKVCRGGRLLLLSVAWTFNRHRGSCVRRTAQRDVTHTLHCRRHAVVRRSRCLPDGFRRIERLEVHLRQCRCVTVRRVRRQRCRCPKTKRNQRCIGHSIMKTTVVSFELKAQHCFRRVHAVKKTIREYQCLIALCRQPSTVNLFPCRLCCQTPSPREMQS